MGFKQIKSEELISGYHPSFIGTPLQKGKRSIEAKKVQIDNEELIYYSYKNNGEKEDFSGKGKITITNTSANDSLWDVQLKFNEIQSKNFALDNEHKWKEIEHKENKEIDYNFSELPDFLRITEYSLISNIGNDKSLNDNLKVMEDAEHLLLLYFENKIKFTIIIENISPFIIEDLEFRKQISKEFYDLESSYEIKLVKNELEWNIPKIGPKEKKELIFYLKVNPTEIKDIETGNIDIIGNIKSEESFSGIKIEDFSALSHTLQAIEKREKEDQKDKWDYSLIFKNNSEFEIELNSISIKDEIDNKIVLDLKLNKKILPNKSYVSDVWEGIDNISQNLAKQVNYSVNYEIKHYGKIHIQVEESTFKIVAYHYEKNFSEKILAQSSQLKMEESLITNTIHVKNTGTTPLNGIIIKERVPEDFLIPTGISRFHIKHSSGKSLSKYFTVKVSQSERSFVNYHTLVISIISIDNISQNLLDINENLEISYPLYIASPDKTIEYKFPTAIAVFFSKFRELKSENIDNFYVNEYNLPPDRQPLLKVGEYRQDLVISKDITPKEPSKEFNILIRVFNNSLKEAEKISILDNFPDDFELISSNLSSENIEGNNNEPNEIIFFMDKVSSSQEVEIKYQIKTKNNKIIDYSDVEPLIYGMSKNYSPTFFESANDYEQKATIKKIEVKNEEYLQFQYNNDGKLNSLTGNGNITVFNKSKKEKIWNTQFELKNFQILASEVDSHINFDTIEPETNKSVTYKVDSSIDIPDPLKITETVNIVNIETQSINDFTSYLNPVKARLISKKKAIIEKKRFNDLMSSITSKLEHENDNLAVFTNQINDSENKKIELSKIIDNLKTEDIHLKEEKDDVLNKKIKEISSKNDITLLDDLDLDSLINEITNQIKKLNDDKNHIEEEARKKEAKLRKELDDIYDPQIKEIQHNLDDKKSALNKTIETNNEWITKRKELNHSYKSLKKENNSLIKTKNKTLNKKLKLISGIKKDKFKEASNKTNERKAEIEEKYTKETETITKEIIEEFKPKIEEIEAKLEDVGSALNNASEEIDKWSNQIKELKTIVKEVKGQHETLINTKNKTLNKTLMEFIPEKEKKLRQLDNQIKSKESHIKLLREIEDKYDNKIEEAESNLKVEQGNLEDKSKEIDEWINEKNEIQEIIKKLEEEHDALTKEEYKYKDLKYLESLLKSEPATTEISAENERKLLIYGKENDLEVTISIENISPYQFQDIVVVKTISNEFYDIRSTVDIEFENEELTWKIPIINPNEKIQLSYYVRINPTTMEGIGTGDIGLSGRISSATQALLSGLTIEKFSAYSHSLHDIFVRDNNGKKESALILKNDSDFEIRINSISILDETKTTKILDLHPEDLLPPGQNFISESWEAESLNAKFFRDVDYTIDYDIQNSGNIHILIDEDYFKMVDLHFEKSYSEKFMAQSSRLNLEESIIENFIKIENKGTTPIDGILIEEVIPEDFILPIRKSDFIIKNSSRNTIVDNFEFDISPQDRDPSIPHTLRILINLNEDINNSLLGVNDIINVYYPLSIFSPNELKKYDFSIEVKPFFSKYSEVKSKKMKSFYFSEYLLPTETIAPIKVGNNRFDQEIKKSIHQTKKDNEFIVNISIKNSSTINLKNIEILDVIPKSFELLSSNVKHEINSDMSMNEYWINFIIDNIEPNGKAEIKYRIKNLTEKELDYSKIEPFIFT